MASERDDITARLDAIEARWKQATPGPWYAELPRFKWRIRSRVGAFIAGPDLGVRTAADAACIAHAPDDIAFLLAVARQQRGVMQSMQS